MTYASLTNWREYQHYKTRNPPWIKLHREVLSSRMWVTCDDASRVLAIACMVLASITENKIPIDHGYLKRLAFLSRAPDFSKLVEIGFIELHDDKGFPLASPSETDQNRDRDIAQASACAVLASSQTPIQEQDTAFIAFWAAYPRKVAKQDALKAWHTTKKLRPAVEKVIEAVHRQRVTADWQKDGGQFIPYPATWLRKGCWDNDITAMNGRNGTAPRSTLVNTWHAKTPDESMRKAF